jgi:hypothetical protein
MDLLLLVLRAMLFKLNDVGCPMIPEIYSHSY